MKPSENQTTNQMTNTPRDGSNRVRVQLTFPENSRWTKQSFKDECDINVLMGRYLQTGQIPNINERAPQYLDVTGIDYQEAMQLVAGAQTLFNELPSAVRTRFDNDPAQFLAFTSDGDNYEEMAEMGLLREDRQTIPTSVLKNQTQPDAKISTSEEANSRTND